MPTGKQKLRLGESWVVEGDAESSFSDEDYMPESTSARRSTRSSERSPEPQFVMPSLDPESMDGSWAPTTSRTLRPQGPRISDREIRMRSSHTRKGNLNESTGSRSTSSKKQPLQLSRLINSGGTRKGMETTAGSYGIVDEEPRTGSSGAQEVLKVAIDHATAMVSWLSDIVVGALKVLTWPLSYLLAIWLLFVIFAVAKNLLTSSVYASLSPVCAIPGASFLGLPFCPTHSIDSKKANPPNVQFDDLMSVQSKFEEVLEETAGSVGLPLDMKRGEASIRDLRQLVRYSHLQSKNELVLEFDGFIETARMASYDLQKFNSHVGRAVDSVISTTRWTTRVLDGIQERDATRGTITAFINDKLLSPFRPVQFTESILLDQYIQHTRLVEEEIMKLIGEAQALLMVLTNLEDRLETMHGIATRDDMHTTALKEEILGELWTKLGGNRGKLSKMDKQLGLIHQVGVYRKHAYAHVSGTIIRLQAMGAGLEDLRERVGSPELLRDRLDIPLSVHIENIQQGVERLESSRQNARKLEDQHIKQTLERGRLEGTLIDG